MVKNLPPMQETWVGKIPWRRAQQPTLAFLPGESPWTKEPGRLQPWGRKESDMTEQSFSHVISTAHREESQAQILPASINREFLLFCQGPRQTISHFSTSKTILIFSLISSLTLHPTFHYPTECEKSRFRMNFYPSKSITTY